MAADPEVIAAVQKKYMPFGGSSFPILFDDGRLRIYKNHCFTTDGRVEPTIVGNMIGWSISRR